MTPESRPKNADGGESRPARAETGASHTPSPAAVGAPSYACACSHSRHAHEGYGRCLEPGCVCWAVRKTNRNDRAAAEPSARS